MAISIGRREFVAALSGSFIWPIAAHAQQPAMPVVGYLHTASPGPYAQLTAAFLQGLKEAGILRARTYQSNTVGLRVNSIGSRRLPLIWSNAK